jgi:hypothetical protein
VEAAIRKRQSGPSGSSLSTLATVGDKDAGRQRLDVPYMARIALHARRLSGAFADVYVVMHSWHAQKRRRGCVGGLDVCTAYKGPLE